MPPIRLAADGGGPLPPLPAEVLPADTRGTKNAIGATPAGSRSRHRVRRPLPRPAPPDGTPSLAEVLHAPELLVEVAAAEPQGRRPAVGAVVGVLGQVPARIARHEGGEPRIRAGGKPPIGVAQDVEPGRRPPKCHRARPAAASMTSRHARREAAAPPTRPPCPPTGAHSQQPRSRGRGPTTKATSLSPYPPAVVKAKERITPGILPEKAGPPVSRTFRGTAST
jgi:hypothetical protein